jgi:structure-specific recognition protein 1
MNKKSIAKNNEKKSFASPKKEDKKSVVSPKKEEHKGKKKSTNKEDGRKRSASKDAPKRPLNAYMLFCQEERKKVQDAGFKGKEAMVELGKRYHNISEKEKKKYEDQAAKLKEEYDKTTAGDTKKTGRKHKESVVTGGKKKRPSNSPKKNGKTVQEEADEDSD